jgi:bacterioferritin
MAKFADRFRQEAVEELGHVESLMEALLRLGIAPHATQLPPVRLGRTLLEMIEIDRVLEVEAVRLYEEAASYCTRLRNSTHHALFERILRDELGHLDELDKLFDALPNKEYSHV